MVVTLGGIKVVTVTWDSTLELSKEAEPRDGPPPSLLQERTKRPIRANNRPFIKIPLNAG